MAMCALCSRQNLFVRGIAPSIQNILFERPVKEERLLRNERDSIPQALLRHGGNILTVYGDASACDIVKSEQQPRDGGLSRSRRTDKCHLFSSRDAKRELVEDRAGLVERENDFVERNSGILHPKRRRPRRILYLIGFVHYL